MADNAAAPQWEPLLRQAVADAGAGGISRVAARLGFTRSYVSQVLNGLKHPVPQSFIARVLDRLHVIAECPATFQPQPRSECKRIASSPAPTHNPLAMRIWKCCRQCPHRPEEP